MEQSNKLIAEFMGMNIHHNDKSMMVTKTPQGNEVIPIDSLQYNSSWDWLMPVISKCFEVRGSDYIECIYHSLDTQDLPFAHESVVNFIKEYNDGKDK